MLTKCISLGLKMNRNTIYAIWNRVAAISFLGEYIGATIVSPEGQPQ